MDLSGLINLIPIDDIAKKLGVSEDVAESAVSQAIPAIVGGMAANAKDAGGAKSLEKALATHAPRVPNGRANVAEIDTSDGEKIVNNVFGPRKNQVVAAVADTSKGGVSPDLIAKLMPIIAPIVISFIASQFLNKKEAPTTPTTTTTAQSSGSGGGIGDLLGGLLGNQGGTDAIGGILGGLLGGGKR